MEKKIVFISSIQIFPPLSGGQLRSANLCRSLDEMGHKVEIYSFTGRKNDYLSLKKSENIQIGPKISEYINRNIIWGGIQFITYKLNLPPLWITILTKFYCPKILTKILSGKDLIIIDFPYLYPILINQKTKNIINTHNAEFELYPSKLYSNIVKKIEETSFKYANQILFCSNNDYEKFNISSDELKIKKTIVPNGVYLPKYQTNFNERKAIRQKFKIPDDITVFLFTGSSFTPNLLALKEIELFVHANIELLITRKILIIVVGSVSNNLFESDYFKIIGPVEDIIDYFKISDFGLNNITSGSGTNVKMIEYIASSLPVISTYFGCRGLDLKPGSDYFLINNNLKDVIIEATQSSIETREQIAKNAFLKNREQLNMNNYLKNIFSR